MRVSEPLVAVTVMSRLEGSAPIETVATTVPSAAVVGEDCVKVAPLSTEKEIGMPLSAWPDAVVAVAVAVTVAAPVFWMLVASSSRVRLAAVAQSPGRSPPTRPKSAARGDAAGAERRRAGVVPAAAARRQADHGRHGSGSSKFFHAQARSLCVGTLSAPQCGR